MKHFLIFISLTSLIACSQLRSFELSNNVENDIKSLLPEGTMKFYVMDKNRQSQRQIELTQKFQQSIRENHDWFLEYFSNIEPGKPMPYHQNLGLTEKEYAELQKLMNNTELVSSKVVEYVISYSNKTIKLTPRDTTKNETVSIDIKNNIVEFDNQSLIFKDTIRITNPQNGFKSEWFGYQWIHEYPSNMEMSELQNLSSLELEQYKFTLGFLKRTGKVYIQIKGREIANGFKTVDYEFPLVEK